MVNPFEDETGQFLVLMNGEGQYSLWPAFRALPKGGASPGSPGARQLCLDWIEAHWTDMRPKSLVEAHSASN